MQHLKQKAFPASWTRSNDSLGFTLVELIVVVTILAILATIGFVSYSSYLTGVRDTNRLAQLVSIHDGLVLYSTAKDLPLPDDGVDVVIGSDPIAYQGYAGSNTLETIDFTKGGQDPRDGQYFSYYLTADRKYFQLMAFLEEEANITTKNSDVNSPLERGINGDFVVGNISLFDQAKAVDYSIRVPTIYGKKLGILTDDDNTPIQENSDVISDGELDISATTDTYRAYFNDDNFIEGDSSVLGNLVAVGLLGGKINIAQTGEIIFEVTGDWDYTSESSTCIDEELFSEDKLEQIQKLYNAGYTNMSIDTDVNLIYYGDDSTPKHYVYAKKISDLSDFNMNLDIQAGDNTTLRLLDTDKSLMRCTGSGRCGTENRPATNTNSEPLFIYRIKLQPICDGATALNDLWSRNSFTFTGSYYRILMQ